ncbi:peptidase [Paracoccus sp. 11-3]|uniref:Peptidase n=2 Tax=Paracoccus amoyensis TaxID=2760093 RepID=A0A926GFE2_9RHOB|nr:peptidase [Paracoccus amoyensis]
MSEVRAATRDAVAKVSERADLPRFDLVVRAGSDVIPDWGVAGHTPAAGVVYLTVNPDRFDAALTVRTLVRQMHHLIRWDGPGYGKSLGEALVSEGLAGHFVLQVLGGKPDPWDVTTLATGLARKAMNEWARPDYDHARWFQGKGDIRKWAGYGLGHKLVAEHLAQNTGADAVTLATTRVDAFRPTMRKLVNEDGPAPLRDGGDEGEPFSDAANDAAGTTEEMEKPADSQG